MYTILIVDDERPRRRSSKPSARNTALRLTPFCSPAAPDDALRLMAQQHVHVLVTDISMPGTMALNWRSASGSCIRGHIR